MTGYLNNNFYDDGYETGRNWKLNYRPGGPWTSSEIEETVKQSEEWFSGFDAGLTEQELLNFNNKR